jgi:hypothetical protein
MEDTVGMEDTVLSTLKVRRSMAVAACALVGALALLASAWATQASANIYWTNLSGGTIGRANIDGTGVNESFIAGANAPNGVAVGGGHIYWSNEAGTIGRANIDGTGVNESFITEASVPNGLAIDGGHVYWTNEGTNTIGRANIDGTGVNQSFITGASAPFGVAVNSNSIYWANHGVITMLGEPLGVAVDGNHVYWANSAAIGRANLDGSFPDQSFITVLGAPFGVAVDSNHVYWTKFNGTIGRANLDGSSPDQTFLTVLGEPIGVAVESPGDALPRLLTAVTGAGPGKSLANKVNVIQADVAANNKTDACGELNAFINEVKAQTGKRLTTEQAASFTSQAKGIKTALGC